MVMAAPEPRLYVCWDVDGTGIPLVVDAIGPETAARKYAREKLDAHRAFNLHGESTSILVGVVPLMPGRAMAFRVTLHVESEMVPA